MIKTECVSKNSGTPRFFSSTYGKIVNADNISWTTDLSIAEMSRSFLLQITIVTKQAAPHSPSRIPRRLPEAPSSTPETRMIPMKAAATQGIFRRSSSTTSILWGMVLRSTLSVVVSFLTMRNRTAICGVRVRMMSTTSWKF